MAFVRGHFRRTSNGLTFVSPHYRRTGGASRVQTLILVGFGILVLLLLILTLVVRAIAAHFIEIIFTLIGLGAIAATLFLISWIRDDRIDTYLDVCRE